MGTLTGVDEIVLGIAAALMILVAVSIPYLLQTFRRAITVESPLPIGKMMQRVGVSPDDAKHHEYALAVAASRCGSCKSTDECSKWLAAEGVGGPAAFCPNAHFLNDLRPIRRKTRMASNVTLPSAES